jgi:DNA-binding transcriptional regulator YhcF (GntR family)
MERLDELFMRFYVDRELPIPLRTQLQGLIEYAISYGDLAAGEALPSVRDLAEKVGVAPMTVSQVYGELRDRGLIETRPGSGTFVANRSPLDAAARQESVILNRQIDALIDRGLIMGLRGDHLASLINARLLHRAGRGRRAFVVMVGLFPEATASYARFIAERLGDAATVEPTTIDALRQKAAIRARVGAADLVITIANRLPEVSSLLPDTKVLSVSFIPSEQTRRSLASLDSMLKIAVVSRFPEFLPIMTAGVRRFAPHVSRITATELDDTGLDRLLAASDVVVYSTGAETVLSRISVGVNAIEYRHNPAPADIERLVAPIVRARAELLDGIGHG